MRLQYDAPILFSTLRAPERRTVTSWSDNNHRRHAGGWNFTKWARTTKRNTRREGCGAGCFKARGYRGKERARSLFHPSSISLSRSVCLPHRTFIVAYGLLVLACHTLDAGLVRARTLTCMSCITLHIQSVSEIVER
jgi:hypothetical protein